MKSNIHVDAELLAAWSEGSLPKDQAAKVDAHLADCSSCQELLAVFARSEPPPVVPVVSGFSRTWRWAIPIAAAATVAAIWVAIPEDERTAQLNQTASAPLSDSALQDQGQRQDQSQRREQEQKEAPRRDAPEISSADRAKKEAPAEKLERFEAAAAPELRERDQDLKTAPPAAASALPPAAAPSAPVQGRLASGATSSLRQAPAEVVSPDPQVHWRITLTGQLERSTDGGKSWVAIALPEQVTVTGVAAPTATTAVATVSDGRQFRTADQGKTWNLVQP